MFNCLDGLEPAIREITVELIGVSHNIALVLLSGLFALALVWNYVQGFIKSGRPVILSTFMGLVLSALFVVFYIPILNGIGTVTCGLIQSFPTYDQTLSLYSDSWSMWGDFISTETNWAEKLVMGNAVGIIKNIINFLRAIVIAFLAVVGPLAVAMDIVPLFKGTALKWFKGIVIVALWGLTIKILDGFLFKYLDTYQSGSAWSYFFGFDPTALTDSLSFTLTSVTFLILYILVPFLTSLYIGSSAAGGAASKIFSIAALGSAVAMRSAGTVARIGSGMRKGSAGASSSKAIGDSVGGSSPSGGSKIQRAPRGVTEAT